MELRGKHDRRRNFEISAAFYSNYSVEKRVFCVLQVFSEMDDKEQSTRSRSESQSSDDSQSPPPEDADKPSCCECGNALQWRQGGYRFVTCSRCAHKGHVWHAGKKAGSTMTHWVCQHCTTSADEDVPSKEGGANRSRDEENFRDAVDGSAQVYVATNTAGVEESDNTTLPPAAIVPTAPPQTGEGGVQDGQGVANSTAGTGPTLTDLMTMMQGMQNALMTQNQRFNTLQQQFEHLDVQQQQVLDQQADQLQANQQHVQSGQRQQGTSTVAVGHNVLSSVLPPVFPFVALAGHSQNNLNLGRGGGQRPDLHRPLVNDQLGGGEVRRGDDDTTKKRGKPERRSPTA
ncbi:MAG: hypothetical protein GY737_25355, partial [Desulfobacteraceae bacterium]|nr:hypothetical protein [Desulfobacteraceae bacterium]